MYHNICKMSHQSIVRLNAYATVNARDWELVKKMVSETKAIVEVEGPKLVLTHECYYDPKTFQCLLVEAFANEEALLNHLQLIKPLSEKYKVDWTVHRLELLGPYSDALIGALGQGRSIDTIFHYGASLGRL